MSCLQQTTEDLPRARHPGQEASVVEARKREHPPTATGHGLPPSSLRAALAPHPNSQPVVAAHPLSYTPTRPSQLSGSDSRPEGVVETAQGERDAADADAPRDAAAAAVVVVEAEDGVGMPQQSHSPSSTC